MLALQMDFLGDVESDQRPVVPVSARCRWQQGLVLAGTVNGVAAASDSTNAPGQIWTAELSAPTGKAIIIPPHCTYLELGAWGDGNAIGTAPALTLWRACGLGAGANGQTVTIDNWDVLWNVLGASSVTLSNTVLDTLGTGSAANRYTLGQGTYQQNLFDLRGSRAVVVQLSTIGTANNWSLWYRCF